MKHIFGRILGLLVLGGCTMGTGPAHADSAGPYYATPSWDQTLPAATRFIVLSNFAGAAVLDRNTGLVWEKSPNPTGQSWTDARSNCITKTVGGQKGFRLPSIVELSSLVDVSVTSPPTLPPGHPFLNVQLAAYWTASLDAGAPESDKRAWWVFFEDGDMQAYPGSNLFLAWCVRGGMNADRY